MSHRETVHYQSEDIGRYHDKIEEIEDNYNKIQKIEAKSPIQLVPFEGPSKEDNVEDSRYSTQTYEFSLDDLNKAYNELINNRSRILDN
ncbi:hypothetical protein RhiirA4_484383 [Rhizophagus irregularis]|uniref:Uncharacterized protein n=1 Tax=Rhizophagus irregularis TaxID=588596 RepID=A0A2I1HP16_9GLOM|nr:hypothetical protein RhiirA4_484383 [Rhizophagus irregularis]